MFEDYSPAEKQVYQYIEWCQFVANFTEATIRGKRSYCWSFIEKMNIHDIKEITENEVNEWVRCRLSGDKGFSKISVNALRSEKIQIMAFLKWVHNTQGGTKIRFPYIVNPKPEPVNRKFYSGAEIDDMIDKCKNLKSKMIISLAFDTGLRRIEIVNIKFSDIVGNQIKTIGKGRKLGFVYFSNRTRKLIEQFSKTNESGEIYLLKRREECRAESCASVMTEQLKHELSKIGYPNFQIHELRHSFATDLQKKGARIEEIQKLMRHGDPAITQRYLHGLDGVLGDVWAKYKG